MRNFNKLFGIIALAAVIGFSMIACDDGGGVSGGGGGNDNNNNNDNNVSVITWTFNNLSSATVNITCHLLTPSEFFINPKGQKTATSSTEDIGAEGIWSSTTPVSISRSGHTFTFRD